MPFDLLRPHLAVEIDPVVACKARFLDLPGPVDPLLDHSRWFAGMGSAHLLDRDDRDLEMHVDPVEERPEILLS